MLDPKTISPINDDVVGAADDLEKTIDLQLKKTNGFSQVPFASASPRVWSVVMKRYRLAGWSVRVENPFGKDLEWVVVEHPDIVIDRG